MKTLRLSLLIAFTLVFAVFSCGDDSSDNGGTGTGTGTGSGTGTGTSTTAGIVVDHTCTSLSSIPSSWITTVKNSIKLHYAHTSHGEQLTGGLTRIEEHNSTYNVEIGDMFLPAVANALCIFNGQKDETYITPDLFWQTHEGMERTRDVLKSNPTINVCMWCWCTQLDDWGQEQVQEYLDSMSALEREFPKVKFVYFTGNAQQQDYAGYNRNNNNNQIRRFCSNNKKNLFDFEDLDCWWFNPATNAWEQATYNYNGNTVPYQHPHFDGDENGHTTWESCEQKGNAVWWLLAKLAGW